MARVTGDGPTIAAANGPVHGLSIAMSAIASSRPTSARAPSTNGQPHTRRRCRVGSGGCGGEGPDSGFSLTRDVAHGGRVRVVDPVVAEANQHGQVIGGDGGQGDEGAQQENVGGGNAGQRRGACTPSGECLQVAPGPGCQ